MKATFDKTTKIGRTTALCLAAVLAALLVVLAGVASPAEAEKKKGKKDEKIVFASDRTTGKGVRNPDGDFEIFVAKQNGEKLEQLTRNKVDDFDATLSPDGKEIAYVSQNFQSSNPEGDSEVYLMDADGSNQQNLTNTAGAISDQNPDFSPDGQEIAFTSSGIQPSNPEGDFEVYLMNTDGANQRNITNNANLSDFASDFSPDGQEIAFSGFGVRDSNPEGDFEVYLMNVDGSDQRNITNTAGAVSDFDAVQAPDGQKIAYVSVGVQSSNREGDDEIYLMKTDGSKQRNITKDGVGVNDVQPVFAKAKK